MMVPRFAVNLPVVPENRKARRRHRISVKTSKKQPEFEGQSKCSQLVHSVLPSTGELWPARQGVHADSASLSPEQTIRKGEYRREVTGKQNWGIGDEPTVSADRALLAERLARLQRTTTHRKKTGRPNEKGGYVPAS